jgi:hypothetical protein
MDDLDDELTADVDDYIAIDDMATWWRGNHMAAMWQMLTSSFSRKMTLAHSIC